jgi:hypothetical protein
MRPMQNTVRAPSPSGFASSADYPITTP